MACFDIDVYTTARYIARGYIAADVRLVSVPIHIYFRVGIWRRVAVWLIRCSKSPVYRMKYDKSQYSMKQISPFE